VSKFSILVADPPWSFKDNLPGKGRGARKHYGCLDLDSIKSFLVDGKIDQYIADDALLFLWRVASMQDESLATMRAWGFGAPKSEIVWVKMTKDMAKPKIGMGHYTRNAHEVCLIGARGKAAQLIADHGVPSVITAPPGAHSAKPDEFYAAVNRLRGGNPVLELFARRQQDGWACMGDQLAAAE
jgi:N6-adenosine-specific RNA methylase IME4